MDKENSMFYAERMKFIVATMTKDYEKAINIAHKILKTEPGDTMMNKYLSALENRKLIDYDTDTTDSDSEISDDSTAENVISDSESDTSCQETDDEKKGKIYSNKVCRISDYEINAKTSCSTSYDDYHCVRNEKTEKFNVPQELKGKLIRVLPIILKYNKINRNT